jgi:hypothetical protein
MPCPIGRLPIDEPEYCEGLRTRPRSSPGRSTFVGEPKPKRRTQRSKRRAPIFRPTLIAPTLLDWARICEVVIRS